MEIYVCLQHNFISSAYTAIVDKRISELSIE